MRPGRAADHSPPSSAAVMEEYPPSGPHRACNRIILTLPYLRGLQRAVAEDSVHLIPNMIPSTSIKEKNAYTVLEICGPED